MIKKKDIMKIFLIIPIIFFRKSNLLMDGLGKNLPVAELFLQNIFAGNPSRTDTDVIIAMFGLLEIIVFNLLFGSHIYRDLYESSIYIFIRVKSRRKWFISKVLELFGYSGIYNLLFLGFTFVLCIIYSNQEVDIVAIRILVITYVLVLLFAFFTTLMINVIAIYTGAVKSFVINYVMLVILSFLAIKFEAIPILNHFPILLKLNPVANVIINWNAGIGEGLFPAIYFLILIVLAVSIGSILIDSIDISINGKEFE